MKRVFGILSYSVVFITFTACSSLEGPETNLHVDRSQIIAKIEINSGFVMVKKDDTLQLAFKAIAVNDSIVPVSSDRLSWRSEDPLKVEIDSVGRIVGKTVNNSPVKAILTYQGDENITADTVLVLVTSNRYDGATVKLVQIDSNIVGGGNFLIIPGLTNPRIRVDIEKDDTIVIKGMELPLSVRSPLKLQLVINGGPDGEPVYRLSNSLIFTGPFWVKTSVSLYGDIVSDSLMFVGEYAPVNVLIFVSADEFGNVIPKSLDTLDLEPQLQPCGVFMISNFTTKTIDIVFSDSADVGFTCDPLPSPLFGVNSNGGNLLSVGPFSRGNRRIISKGIVSYFVRDAVTKERLPYSGRYESISAKN